MGQLNGLTYHAWVGVVMALPELVSEDGDKLGILPFRSISRKNSAAEQSGNAEVSECVSREVDRSQVFGEISSGCRQVPLVHRSYALDRSGLPKLLQLRTSEANPAWTAGIVVDNQMHHALGVGVRIRIYENGIDHTEHCSRGADAEGEREDGDNTESG